MKTTGLIAFILAILSAHLHGQDLPWGGEIEAEAVGTGKVYGQVAHLTLSNTGNDTVKLSLPPAFIPANGKKSQPYVVPGETDVSIDPGQSVDVDLEGYCAEPDIPAADEDDDLHLEDWYWSDLDYGGFPTTEYADGMDTLCMPGMDFPMSHVFEDSWDAAPYIIAFTQYITEICGPERDLPPGVPHDELIQQSVWIVTAILTGEEYTFEDALDGWEDVVLPHTDTTSADQMAEYMAHIAAVYTEAESIVYEELCFTPGISHVTEPPDMAPGADNPVPPPEDPPDDPPPPEEVEHCELEYDLLPEPAMKGGLDPDSRGDFEVAYLEPLPLVADGRDFDMLLQECLPSEECEETPSMRKEPLSSRVRYEWRIKSGQGFFLINDTGRAQATNGKSVLFMPPDMYDNFTGISLYKTTTLELKVIDDLPGQPQDATITHDITINTNRDLSVHDTVFVSVSAPDWEMPYPPEEEFTEGSCLAKDPEWSQKNELAPPVVQPYDSLLHTKQRIVLRAQDIRDPDRVFLRCKSDCQPDSLSRLFGDNVEWRWDLVGNSGAFLTGHEGRRNAIYGREVVYEAPADLEEEERIKERIAIRVFNPAYATAQSTSSLISSGYQSDGKVLQIQDEIYRDTITVTIDCKPKDSYNPTSFMIGWSDKFNDHDDPNDIEILADDEHVITGQLSPTECEPRIHEKFKKGSAIEVVENGAGYELEPDSRIGNDEDFNFVDNQRFCVEVGSFLFVIDVAIIIDNPYFETPDAWELDQLSDKFNSTLIKLMDILGFQFLESLLSESFEDFAEELGLSTDEVSDQLSDIIWSIQVEGEMPDNEVFEAILEMAAENDEDKTVEDIRAEMEAIIASEEGLAQNELVQDYELGYVFSGWIFISRPGNCPATCPLIVKHYTNMHLGDTDHFYTRNSQVHVITHHNGHSHTKVYDFKKSKKGSGYPD